MDTQETYPFAVIGIVRSCYTEKFGIPRQPGLVSAAEATLELLPPYNRPEAVKGLEGFSHVWVSFIFHAVKREQWRPTVRPPRLGGNERLGVFATRSTHRPNPLGLSVVRLAGIDTRDGRVVLKLQGADLLDGTPVVDIKPYIPYVDSIADATAGFAPEPPQAGLSVEFSDAAKAACERFEADYPGLKRLITQVLLQDPRPAYQVAQQREYGFSLYDLNVRFRAADTELEVVAIERTGGV